MTATKCQSDAHFTVKVVPGSSRTVFCGMYEGIYKIRVAAPPEKGKANKALITYLAALLTVKKNAVAIVSGHSSPIKHIIVEGIDVADVTACFNTLCPA